MVKYIGALLALTLMSSAASATIVTINYSGEIQNEGTISGTLSFDTKKLNRVFFQDVGIVKISAYESSSFVTSFNIYGTQFSGPFKAEYGIYGAPGESSYREEYAFYAPIPGIPVNMSFAMRNTNPAAKPFPDFGYENYQGFVNLVDQATGGGIDVAPATFTVSYANAVPEPATWAMMIGGVGMVGGALRRRKSMQAAVAA